MIIQANLTPDERDEITDAILEKVKNYIMTSENGEEFLDSILLHGCDGFVNMDDIALAQTTSDWGYGEMLDEMDVTWGDEA